MLTYLQDSATIAQANGDHDFLSEILDLAFDARYITVDHRQYSPEPMLILRAAIGELVDNPKITTKRLNARFWSTAMIDSYLPPPFLVDNPHGYAAKMRVWAIADVVRAEKTMPVNQLRNQLKNRREKICA